MKPKRGDVCWVTWEPARGVEQRGRRPALVVQNDRGNQHSSYTVVAAISSAPLPRVYPFTVPFAAGDANLSHAGHVNCAHLLTIDQGRLEAFIGTFDDARMGEVAEALRYQLDL